MAFPVVESSAVTSFVSADRVLDVAMPSGLQEDDFCIVFAACDNAANIDRVALNGFTLLAQGAAAGTTDSHWVFYRRCRDAEPSTRRLAVGASATEGLAAIAYRVSGMIDIEAAVLESTQDYAVAVPNPTLAPSWGAADTLWFAATGRLAVTAAPSGYTGLLESGNSSSAASYIAAAHRQVNTASETPGSWSTSFGGSAVPHIAFTVACRPGSFGSSTVIVIED